MDETDTSQATWAAIEGAFETLLETLSWAQNALLADAALPAWTTDMPHHAQHPEASLLARQKIASLLGQLTYVGDQDPREAIRCPGFVAASPSTLQRIHALNEAKLAFRDQIVTHRQAKHISVRHSHTFHQGWLERARLREHALAHMLQDMGLARLHLKQCYRLLPVASGPLCSIRWTWANTRAIKKISTTQALALLHRKGSDAGIEQQRQRLASLPEHEPLALVQELKTHLRANIYCWEAGERVRRMIKCHLPLIYPHDPERGWPDFAPCKDIDARSNTPRVVRADTRLEEAPFLPAIHAHRYKAGYRTPCLKGLAADQDTPVPETTSS